MNPRPLLLSCSLALLALPAQADDGPDRVAVMVGANAAAPGRRPLLFARRDAEKMADVLTSVGGFRPEDVTLLKDPTPAALMQAVQSALARLADRPHALFYFYYSGHADEQALYPGGQPLKLAGLRKLIDEAPVSLKVGVMDACRGGGWTHAKGLSPAEPFAVNWPVNPDSEGSVLIASSSGLESAHESDQLQGSFFTFHFAAGLRGAADVNGNNIVTLTEAFEYAKERTIWDTERMTFEIQHPSYAINLRGRHDLVLANIASSPSTLEISEHEGPLQVIHADSGLKVIELAAGERHLRVAVPPGRYLLRRTTPTGNLIKEIVVLAGAKNTVDEDQLTLVGTSRLAVKSAAVPGMTVEDLPPPPPVSHDIRSLKVGAVVTAAAAVVALGFGIKSSWDIGSHDKDLDEFRRFPCSNSPTGLCNADRIPKEGLTQEQVAYVQAKETELASFHRTETTALIVAGVAAAASGALFYAWYRHDHPHTQTTIGLAPFVAGSTMPAPGFTIALTPAR
jgi:hypothetical protein